MTLRPLAAALLLVAAVAPAAQTPVAGELVINEILYDPPAPQASTNEWVEIVNTSARTIDLNDVQLGDSGTLVEVTGTATPLAAGAFAVLVRDAAAFAAVYPGVTALVVQVPGFPTLNNTGDTVRLVATGGAEVDAVPYLASWGGTDASLERRDPGGSSTSATNFGTSTDASGATPGRVNSLFAPDTTSPTLTAATASADGRTVTLTLSEPAVASTVTAGAFTTQGPAVTAVAYTPGSTTVVLTLAGPLPAGPSTIAASGLRDARGNTTVLTTATVTFTPDTTAPALVSVAAVSATTLDVTFSEPLDAASVQPADFSLDGGIGAPTGALASGATVRLTFATPLANATAYTLTAAGVADAVGNTLAGGTLGFFFGTAEPPQPGDVVINEVMFDPPAPQPSTNEWIEVVNRSGRAVDLGELVVRDATGASGAAPSPLVVAPGGYAVFGANAAAFAAAYPGVPFTALSSFPSLNNAGDRVSIAVGGVEIDAVPYLTSWGGTDASLERRDPRGPSTSATNFGTSTDPARATPGRANSIFAPDVSGPRLTAATASPDGRTVTVTLDEPADAATVTASAFAVAGRTVTSATYDAAALTVALTLDAPLAGGTTTVTATGLRDGLGNTTATSAATVVFTPDTTAPALARAFAASPTTVRLVFTEPVTLASAGAASAYSIDGGVGAPTAVAPDVGDGGVVAVVLTLAAPLADRQVYTVTATGLTDLAGVTRPATSAAFFVGAPDTPEAGDVVIHELMFDPAAGSEGEFVELLNTTPDRIFDLSQFTLDGERVSTDPVTLLPGQYAVLARDLATFTAAYPGVAAVEVSSLSLSNAGDRVVLAAGDAVIDSLTYDPAWHRPELDDATGISLERRDPAGPSGAASNWSSSLDPSGATPGRANTLSVAGNPQPRDGGVTVTSPFAPDEGQAAEIGYTLAAPAGLVRVRIYDGGGRLVREVEDGRLSGATGRVVWDGRGDGGESLRAGIYIVLLEAVDVEGGTTEAHRAAIVLARR